MSECGGDGRFRGILTPDDREAIAGSRAAPPSPGPDPGAVRHARYRIRERTKRALTDLAFLSRHLPSRDRQLVFEEFVSGEGREQLFDVFELFTLGIYDSASAFEAERGSSTDDPHEIIRRLVREGVRGAEWAYGGYQGEVHVAVDADRRRPDPQAAFERFRRGHASNVDIAYLSHWCDDVPILEHVIETGESYRFVRGPAWKYGDECLQEFTPEDARHYLELEGELDGEDG